jgi:hypothetical protein
MDVRSPLLPDRRPPGPAKPVSAPPPMPSQPLAGLKPPAGDPSPLPSVRETPAAGTVVRLAGVHRGRTRAAVSSQHADQRHDIDPVRDHHAVVVGVPVSRVADGSPWRSTISVVSCLACRDRWDWIPPRRPLWPGC